MTNLANSRKEAVALGVARFRSDNPCIHGHIGQRYTISGVCVECAAKHTVAHREKMRLRYEAAKKAAAAAREAELELICSGATARIDAQNELQDLVDEGKDFLRGPGHEHSPS